MIGRRSRASALAAERSAAAELAARAVEGLPREPCPHSNVRPSCPRCARREALKEAAAAARTAR